MPVRPPWPQRLQPPALLGKARREEWEEAQAALGRAVERMHRHGPTWQVEVDAAEARIRALAERDYTRSALRRARAG